MYYVYVLKSQKYKKSYIGHTNDLQRRLTEHNQSYSKYTDRYKPWRIFYKEEYSTEKEAVIKEKYFKTHAGRIILKELFNEH